MPIGGLLKILGGAIVTCHCTQLTTTITDSATTMKMVVQNNAASEASRKMFGLYPQLWHSGDTLVANEVKNFSNEFVWGGKTAVWGLPPCPCPLPGYVTVCRLSQGHSLYQVWNFGIIRFWVIVLTNRQRELHTDRWGWTPYSVTIIGVSNNTVKIILCKNPVKSVIKCSANCHTPFAQLIWMAGSQMNMGLMWTAAVRVWSGEVLRQSP